MQDDQGKRADSPVGFWRNSGRIFRILLDILAGLMEVRQQLTRIERRVAMALTKADFDAFRDSINAEIARIVAKIQELIDKQNAGGLTADEEAQVAADIQKELDTLKTVGVDAPPQS